MSFQNKLLKIGIAFLSAFNKMNNRKSLYTFLLKVYKSKFEYYYDIKMKNYSIDDEAKIFINKKPADVYLRKKLQSTEYVKRLILIKNKLTISIILLPSNP